MHPFTHIPEFHVLVGISWQYGCQYAVLPMQANSHLAGAGHRMANPDRAVILEWMNQIENRIISEDDLAGEFKQPPPKAQPVPGLRT